jgi:tetratricopeptide (TPR) repeat protein
VLIVAAVVTLGWYLKLLVWPHPLTHDYYPYQVPKVGWSDWRALLSLALYAAMGIVALLNLRKRRVPAYAIAFFLITLSIVSNLFVSVGTFMNERFVYTPSVAFCLLGGWFFARYLPKLLKSEGDGASILGTGLFVLAAATFAWLTLTRVPDWENKLTLNTSAVKNSPNSARAHCFYAVALYDEVFLKDNEKPAGQKMTIEERLSLIDSMDVHIMRAVQINPKYGSAWQMLPGVSFARFDAQRDLQQQKGGKGPQMDRLFNDFDQALTNVPKNPEVKRFIVACVVNLANSGGNPNKIVQFCYHQGYERFFKERKEPQAALSFLEAALQTNFEDERLFNALAEVYTATGNPSKAAAMQQRAAVARTIDPSK